MPHYTKHLNILIMPTDACNINCVYCFHKPYTTGFNKMDLSMAEHLFDITAPYYSKVNIIWHGGEPLLMGLEFYKDVMKLQRKYNCQINNSIQSNLTLLTSEMADFFAENNITVSGSFDGVCNEQLRGHSNAILTGRQLMVDRGKKCGLIMVVSNRNVDHLIESYHFFKNIGVNFSLNLYLDPKENKNQELRLKEDIAVQRLCELFDYWLKDNSGTIHISYFRDIIKYILENKKNLCCYTSCLGRWIGLYHDGTLGPCNRYFPKEYSFGNIQNYSDIGEAFESDGFTNLLTQAIARREKCKSCDIFAFCSGGCNNTALNENGLAENGGLSCRILLCVYQYIDKIISNMNVENIDKNKYNPLFLDMLKKEKIETNKK